MDATKAERPSSQELIVALAASETHVVALSYADSVWILDANTLEPLSTSTPAYQPNRLPYQAEVSTSQPITAKAGTVLCLFMRIFLTDGLAEKFCPCLASPTSGGLRHLLPDEESGWRVKFDTALQIHPPTRAFSRGGGGRRPEVGTKTMAPKQLC